MNKMRIILFLTNDQEFDSDFLYCDSISSFMYVVITNYPFYPFISLKFQKIDILKMPIFP